MRPQSRLTIVALSLALMVLASTGTTQSATPTPVNAKSGIDVTFPNAVQGRDYAVEQLYHDPLYDDRSVVYIKQNTPINLAHNANNIDPQGKVIGASGNGIIRYKIDGDELWEGESGRGNAQPYAEAANDYTTHPTVRKYAGAFSLGGLGVAGKVGDNGLAQTNWNHYHNGTLDAFGDEWHTLTYWDDDSLWFSGTVAGGTTSVKFENTSDGKIVQLVVNPKAPVISFQASGGDQYYTTPAKTYYIPKIHEQKTYISSGAVKMILTNLYDSQSVYYRVAGGSWQSLSSGQGLDFNSMYSASKGGAPQANAEYLVEYKNGSTGKLKTRKIHVAPASPAAKEKNGKFFWRTQAEKDAVKARLGRAPYSNAYGSLKSSNTYTKADLNFRSGTRYWNVSGAGGWKSHRQVGYAAVNNGFVAAIEGYAYSNYAYANRAKQALLASFTVDPIGDESPMAVAYSAPSQDRVYYGFERRMHVAFPAGYDLMADYTTVNGYTQGFTPIEELKVRDNLGSEALQLLHRHDSERARANWMVGNDLSLAAFAMAMPTYNTPQYGTAGADVPEAGYSGPTPAAYLDAPFPGQKVTWWDASTDPNVPRGSFPNLVNKPSLFTYHSPNDGYWKEGHLGQYNQQLVPYITPLMNFRNNFDGGRYKHLEEHATGVVHNRHPQNGKSLASANGHSERNDSVLGLINSKFPQAGLYRWHLDTPSSVATNYANAVYNDYNLAYNLAFFDDTVAAEPPAKDLKGSNTFTTISDPNNAKAIFGRLQGQDFNDINIRWVGQATDFMIDAFGEHLLVRPGSGMSGLPVYAEGYNTVLVDDTDSSYNTGVTMGTKANIVRGFTPSYMSYAAVRTDSSGSFDTGHYKSKAIVNERHMLSPDKRFFILIDNLKSGSGSHTYGLTLHGSTNGSLSNMAVDDTNDVVTWTKPSGVKLRAQVISPGVAISKYSGKSTITNYTEPYVIAKAGGANLRFLTLLNPLDAGAAAPAVTKLNTSTVRAARIVDNGATYRVHTKDGSTADTVDNRYTSDAEIGLAKEAGGVFDYLLMINGKTFSFAGTSYLASANPISATLNKVSSGLNLKIEAGASGFTSTGLTVGGLKPGSGYKLIEDGTLKANITADSAGKYTYTQDVSRQHDVVFELGSGSMDNEAPVMGQTTAAAEGTDTIKVSWTAATDDSGIAAYKVYRGTSETNLALIAQTSSTEYTDTNLSASTTYYYQVEAVDNAGNSARGSIVNATTYSVIDQNPPAAPSGLTAQSASDSDAVKITWQANSESDLAGYELYRDGAKLKTGLTGTAYTDSGLTPGRTYYYELAAVDEAGNVGPRTTTVSATARSDRYEESAAAAIGSWGVGGNNAFSATKNLFSAVTGDKLTFAFEGTAVSWIATKYDQRGIAQVYLDGVYQQDVDLYAANPIKFQQAVWSKANLAPGNHTLEVRVSGSKNTLSYAPRIDADAFDVTPAADLTPPIVTIAPVESVITGQSKTLYGSASDDGTVDRVELAIIRSHDGAYWNGLDWSALPAWNAAAGSGGLTFDWSYIWSLPSSDGQAFTVQARAVDAAGNIGYSSESPVSVDNIAPSGTIAVNGGAAWTREPLVTVDNIVGGATAMRFSADGGQSWTFWEWFAIWKDLLALPEGDGIKTVIGEFKDNAGNVFRTTDAIRLDTNPPGQPTGLRAAGKPDTDSVSLSWQPNNESDLYGYILFRDGVRANKWLIMKTGYIDAGLSRGRTYHYELAAVDFAGNVGPKTTIASATVGAERREETAATYKGGWSTGTNSAFSAGKNSFSAKSGDQVTYAFKGTGIVWIATKYDQRGLARVYLDGVYRGDVDLYSPPGDIQFQQAVWSKTDLAPGSHTLVIKVTGQGRTGSKANKIDVDAFDVIPADTKAPITSLSAPAYTTEKSSDTSFRIAWSTRDPSPSSGIREVYVQYKRGKTSGWKPWLKTSKKNKANFRGAEGRPYFFRVRAKDRAGNIGPWSTPKRVIVPHDETVFKFSRGWRRVASKTVYLGTERVGSAGRSAKFKFTGLRVTLIGSRGPRHGRTKVIIDGRRRAVIDAYAPRSAERRVLASFRLKSRGPHTIRLKNLATRDRPYFHLDAIAVLR